MLFHCRKAIETASVLWMLWGSLLLSSPVSIYAERVHRDGETSAPGISSGSAINFSLLNGIVRVHARYLNESLQDASERSAHNTGQVKNAGSSSRKKSSAKGSRSQVFEIQFDYGWGNSRGSGRAMDVDTLALDRAAIEYARYLSYVEDAKRIPAGVFRKTQEQAREFTGTLWSQLREISKSVDMTKCYEPYGCFSISYPWSSLRRPVTFFPESPDKVDPQYCLYTRRNPTECHNLRLGDPTSIFRSNLVAKHKTFFISHGYLETAAKPWVQRMVAELLRKSDVNVVTVDWVGGSGPPYTQAVSNIRLVGVMTAHLIKLMMEEAGVNPVKIHLIGHSLGSHVSGYIGLQMKEFGARIGRITGMDPADPQFDGTDPMVRLDPTDAIFVDIIHTDTRPFVSGGFGLAAPIGHFDVYPNGGEYQPGCNIALMTSKDDETFWRGLKRYIGCNHIRSYEYFTESINSECPFAAVECSSYEDFLAGKCFSCIPHGIHPDMSTNFARLKDDGNHNKTFCTQMGFHAADAYLVGDVPTTPPKTHAKFYLITGDKHPFCRHHYRVTVSIKSSSGIQSGEYGTFYVSIRGKRASYSGRLKANPRAIYFKPGTTHSWVVSGMPVERFTSAKIEWVHGFHLSILRIPSINLSWMKVEVLESGETMMMCAEDKPLKTKTPRHFSMDDSGPCSPASGGSVSLGVMGRRADDEDEEYSDEDEDGQEGVLEAAETRSEAEAKAQKEADEKKAKEEEEKKKNKDPWWKISFPFG